MARLLWALFINPKTLICDLRYTQTACPLFWKKYLHTKKEKHIFVLIQLRLLIFLERLHNIHFWKSGTKFRWNSGCWKLSINIILFKWKFVNRLIWGLSFFMLVASFNGFYCTLHIYRHHLWMHIIKFSLHPSMSSCFVNHSMDMFLKLGLFHLHVHSFLKSLFLYSDYETYQIRASKLSSYENWIKDFLL